MQIDFRTYRLLHFAFILFVSLLAVASLYLLGPEPQPDTRKLLMPGTYFVNLRSEPYSGWFFGIRPVEDMSKPPQMFASVAIGPEAVGIRIHLVVP